MFDIINYWKHSKFFDETNKKILGKMKDTFGGVIVHELVELKWKNLIKKLLDTKWKGFKVKKHKLGTHEIDKISWSCFDDIRYVLDDGIYTLTLFS